MTTRQVWKLDDQGRPTRLVTVQTIEYAVKTPPRWFFVLIAVVVVGGALMDGGIWW